VVALYSATTVNPEIVQSVSGGLCATELKFSVVNFATSRTDHYILECDLLVVRFPGVRKNGILGDLVSDEAREADTSKFGIESQVSTPVIRSGACRRFRGAVS
jgi:hypothetical protein